MLAQWEVEYRHDAPDSMLEYVENHYRYEDMPEHQNTDVAIELAAQRARTMQAIRAGIREREEKRGRGSWSLEGLWAILARAFGWMAPPIDWARLAR